MYGSGTRIPQYRNTRDLWIALNQHLYPLPREIWKVEKYTGDITAWMRERSSHTAGNGVSFQVEYDNRNGARGQMSGVQYRRAIHDEHIHIFRYDFCYQRRDLSWVTFRRSSHNLDLRGSSVARNPQAAQDSLYTRSRRRFGPRIDKTDSWDFGRLLPVNGKRPHDGRDGQKYAEIPPPHGASPAAETL